MHGHSRRCGYASHGIDAPKSQMQALLAVYTRPGKFVTDIQISGEIGSLLGGRRDESDAVL